MPGRASWIGIGALIVGAAGFGAGFVGPAVLNPDANQGPLMGVFITGPLGAALGALTGSLIAWRDLEHNHGMKILFRVAGALALVTLWFAFPSPVFRGNLVVIEALECKQPAEFKQEAIAHWQKRIADAPWAAARPNWKENFEELVKADPGVVLTVRVAGAVGVYENRKPWNSGSYSAGQAWWVKDRYFVRGISCDMPVGRWNGGWMTRGENANGWPPEKLANFLDLMVLEPPPEHLLPLLPPI